MKKMAVSVSSRFRGAGLAWAPRMGDSVMALLFTKRPELSHFVEKLAMMLTNYCCYGKENA
jgi:hypothetical protein